MLPVEGYNKSLKSHVKAWRFFAGFAFDLAWSALPVLRKGYHPRNHPICTTEQNQIAIAWRDYHNSGGNTEFLPDEVMAQLAG